MRCKDDNTRGCFKCVIIRDVNDDDAKNNDDDEIISDPKYIEHVKIELSDEELKV